MEGESYESTESSTPRAPSVEHSEEQAAPETAAVVEIDVGYEPVPENFTPPPLSTNGWVDYLAEGDVLLKHISRQSTIVSSALQDRSELPLAVGDLSLAYERELFSPRVPPKRQPNGTCEANPRLNFYPAFTVPEVLATYHIFFQNHKIPLSCRANRTRGDRDLFLKDGARLPDFRSLSEVPKIFEGLGQDEKRAANSLEENRDQNHPSALVELEGDNARLAVLKRSVELTHFAYPAVNLPPKVMTAVMDHLLIKRAKPIEPEVEADEDEGKPVVSDEELARWLQTSDSQKLEERRKTMMAVVLITTQLECLHRFFSHPDTLRKLEETLHYTFRHGYVKQACKISNVELSNLISYLGILHENRLGQNVLHCTLKGEARRDYVRDCIFLFLVYTWQTGMGVWQQCLEEANLRELEKLLDRSRRGLWSGFDERTIAKDLADIVFPPKLVETLRNGLPDFMSQSMIQNFRSFILERSGILPATCCALPTDFVPLTFKESPPPLWPYTYLLRLANYIMFHSDLAEDFSGEGLMECHCRCNLCTPHRSLVCNTPLLNESQIIGTFEIQGPSGDSDTGSKPGLKLTAGLWTSAYLRKFVPEDYHAHEIKFYENQSKPPKADLTACVITQSSIVGQLQAINQARQEFLLKKGKGVYLDPQTGDELNGAPSAAGVGSRHVSSLPESRAHEAAAAGGGGLEHERSGGRLGGNERRGGVGSRRGGGHRGSRRRTLVAPPVCLSDIAPDSAAEALQGRRCDRRAQTHP
ncbi:100K [simian adenovirus 55]|uniref:Shutoff protein n=1 Tax=simian adenovirus 55 TaxID=2848082 RepID=A0A1L3INX3_9ADEN|nr:100K [Simian mastadenovirus WIV19]APG53807.1 100K [Simian mastadenovirus WIV19]